MDDLAKSLHVLGLQPGASPEAARQAYRDLVNVWHPDRFSHDDRLRSKAQEKLKEINGAYEVVKASFFDQGTTPPSAAVADAGSPSDCSADAAAANTARRWGLFLGAGVLLIIMVAAGMVLTSKRKADGKLASLGTSHRPMAPHYALAFNGNGHVEFATTGSLAGTFTVECWAMTSRPKGTETIVCSRGPKDFSFDIKFREGKRFHGDIGDGARWLARMANASFRYNPGIWYHIAYVVTPDRYAIYVNGALADAGQIDPRGQPVLYDADHQLLLGTDALESANLDGRIAEFRIWKVARTAEQISQNMHARLSGEESGLQGYWRFDEGAGSETADRSGHGFGGKLVGPVEWTTNAPPLAN